MKKGRFTRLAAIFLITAMILPSAAGCGSGGKLLKSEGFEDSGYKHINNGGLGEETLPYNVDTITGATLTVEGPGVVTSIPLSVKEIENRNDGLRRAVYKDSTGKHSYEGLDVAYLLKDMVEGDNGIILTDTAYRVVFKNSNREAVAELTVDEILKAAADGQPVLLAYGIGTADEQTFAPFVFDAKTEGEHSLGYVEELGNDDGCIKLVFNSSKYGSNKDYKTFSNVAYVYICEETEPGFKHSESQGAYSSSKYTDYLITLRGGEIGAEYDFTVGQLEDLVSYDAQGNVVSGGIGYSDWYSLANNAYWYVNEYEGLELYKLLMYLGMDSYEDMGRAKARTTFARFYAADGRESTETFSVESLSYPDAFGFYNKNSTDLGDGSYVPVASDLVKTGYPILLAYGVNNYPYTVSKQDDGYLSGLSNGGGPMRIVFGKTQYNHANGSNQVQQVQTIVIGEDILYNTHLYTSDEAAAALADEGISVKVYGSDGSLMTDTFMSAGDIEELIYGENVKPQDKKTAFRKDLYPTEDSDRTVYEGVDLEYLLMDVLGLAGTNGEITFTSENGDTLTLTLQKLFSPGYNSALSRSGLDSIIAYAKNGAAMVAHEDSEGYINEKALKPFGSEPAAYTVDNAGGPLCIVVPDSSADAKDAKLLENVVSVSINLEADSYAHLSGDAAQYADDVIRFYGEGLYRDTEIKVSDIEAKQRQLATLDYSVLNSKGELTEERYRGIYLYDLFTMIGIRSNAGDVTVYCEDGTSAVFSLGTLKRTDYVNYADPSVNGLFCMLAYGTGEAHDADLNNGMPLTPENGGPVKLIVPMADENDVNRKLCLSGVTAIEVSAHEITTWGHTMSDIYSEFLDFEITLTVKNDEKEVSKVYTLGELEAMEGFIVRDSYSVLDLGECEGIDLWKFVKYVAGASDSIDDPVSVTVYATDGYKNDILSVVYNDGLVNGVLDANGDRKAVIICYATKGYPLVDSEGHEGYTGIAANCDGPARIIVENTQGASVKYFGKLVVTLPGNGNIVIE